jgi:hypothetical protein
MVSRAGPLTAKIHNRQPLRPGVERIFQPFSVPTLVPKPGSSTVTQGNLRRRGSDAERALGLA